MQNIKLDKKEIISLVIYGICLVEIFFIIPVQVKNFSSLHHKTSVLKKKITQSKNDLLSKYEEILGKDALKRLHIHLSGIEYSSKGERNHLPILESDLNLDAILQALFDKNCSGKIVCESPGEFLEKDALTIQKKWIILEESNHESNNPQ